MKITQQRQALLKDKNTFFFFLSTFITMGAGAMCYVSLTWHVMSYESNKVMSSLLISLFFWLPSLLAGPFVGVLIDRYPRLNLMMAINSVRVIAFLLFAIGLSYADHLWMCCCLNTINGFVFTTVGPTSMALIPELVDEDTYLVANSTTDVSIELGNITGMAVASLLMSWMSIERIFYLTALVMAVGISFLLLVKIENSRQGHLSSSAKWKNDLIAGLSYLRKNKALIVLYFVGSILFAQFMLSPILLAPFIKNFHHGSGTVFGVTELVLCLGILMGSFIIPHVCNRIGRMNCMFIAISWLSMMFFGISLAKSVMVVMLFYGLLGLGLPLWSVIASYSQELTIKSMQGRVQSVSNSMSSLLLILVYVLLAFVNQYFTVAHAYWLCSLMGVLALSILLRFRNQSFTVRH